MRADIGAVFYALAAWLIVYSVILGCRSTPARIPLMPWRGRRGLAAGSGYSVAGAFVLGFAVATLNRPHIHWWVEIAVLTPPIVIGQLTVIAVHNRNVARAEAAADGLRPERSLTGPNSPI
jgi:hypothetical protein